MLGPRDSVNIRHLIWRMFRDAADCDYITARAMLLSKQPYGFYWNASQAIEKYLKCILLQNDISVKKYGHDNIEMFREVQDLADAMLPMMLIPANFIEMWPSKATLFGLSSAEVFSDFIERITSNGDPSNRYRHYSLVFRNSDLHKLDECCFLLRRLCFPLGIEFGEAGKTYLDTIRSDPNFQPDLPLHFIEGNGETLEWERFAQRYNFSFYPDLAEKEGKYLGSGGRMINSEIALVVQRNSKDELKWVLERMHFASADRAQIKKILDDI